MISFLNHMIRHAEPRRLRDLSYSACHIILMLSDSKDISGWSSGRRRGPVCCSDEDAPGTAEIFCPVHPLPFQGFARISPVARAPMALFRIHMHRSCREIYDHCLQKAILSVNSSLILANISLMFSMTGNQFPS
jgi:hypothetical protein